MINYYCCKKCRHLINSEEKNRYKHLDERKTNFQVICIDCYDKNMKKYKYTDTVYLQLRTKNKLIYVNHKIFNTNRDIDFYNGIYYKTPIIIYCQNCSCHIKSSKTGISYHIKLHCNTLKHNANNN